jgi:hypothetical protein
MFYFLIYMVIVYLYVLGNIVNRLQSGIMPDTALNKSLLLLLLLLL